MNNSHALNAENLLRAFPDALRGDEAVAGLAQATATALEARCQEIRGLAIYAHIDELPEGLLDILAKDFKVDWYDADYSLEQKRQTLKDSWRVHRTLGTKAAVVSAISAIYPDTQVLEWWEYGGKPFHFRLVLDSTYEQVDPERHRRVMERLDHYKPLRSVLDEVEYYDAGAEATAYFGAVCVGCEISDSAVAVRY